jgi:hypothetical protein
MLRSTSREFMKPFLLVITFSSLIGTYAHAESGPADTALTGIPMHIAKQLDARPPSGAIVPAVKRSGLPMAVASRHGAATQSNLAPQPSQALSGIPMAIAKRL